MMGLHDILTSTRIYKVSEFDEVMRLVRPNFRLTRWYRKTRYFNVPCAFDIETTSFIDSNGNKAATMYAWVFGIYGAVIVGRTWSEFVTLCDKLVTTLKLDTGTRLMVYVHNLGFDFAFFRKWFEWDKVFSIKERTPVYALSEGGIEFRCSYILSGYSLETVGKNLHTYQQQKLVGDLDYSLIRHSQTPLTEKELGYIVADAKVVMAYIAECIDDEWAVHRIPLTKTGYVRRYCRNMCFYGGEAERNEDIRKRYRRVIATLTLTVEEYYQQKRAFQGGFTHANPFCVGKVIYNITSFDFRSSYPTVMIAEMYPMGPGELIDRPMKRSEFYRNLRMYCCIFELEIINLRPKVYYEYPLSRSRCREVVNAQVFNGRIVRADHVKTTITNVDYMILRKFYEWDSPERIGNFRRYHKDYLPTAFVRSILQLYKDKTLLKDVEGKEAECAKAKEMLNSCYGMTVTDPVREEIEYIDNLWPTEGDRRYEEPVPLDVAAIIDKYNKDKSRFLYYAWGVFVTAYARRNLFTGILEFGEDYCYSDTDSVKVRNAEKHAEYIQHYNSNIRAKLYKAMVYHNLSCDEVEPEANGTKKLMGVWAFDGHYESAKFQGAKRYLVKYSQDPRNKESLRGKYVLTVSGLNKRVALPYMQSRSKDPYMMFIEGMTIPAGQTGKQTHTYIDTEMAGTLTDYLGNTASYHELSGVHLAGAEYNMSFSKDFVDYLLNIQND